MPRSLIALALLAGGLVTDLFVISEMVAGNRKTYLALMPTIRIARTDRRIAFSRSRRMTGLIIDTNRLTLLVDGLLRRILFRLYLTILVFDRADLASTRNDRTTTGLRFARKSPKTLWS